MEKKGFSPTRQPFENNQYCIGTHATMLVKDKVFSEITGHHGIYDMRNSLCHALNKATPTRAFKEFQAKYGQYTKNTHNTE